MRGIAKEPFSFAVKHLSLNIQEVVFLIHDIFVNLRDLGNHKVEKNYAHNELVKKPHDVDEVNDHKCRKV